MNIILIIILINIILIVSLKYSIYLALFFLIMLSVYMIKFYYNIDNVLEGYTNKSNFEEEYRRNFFKLLNKNVKTELNENILFNSIMGNFKELMKLLNVRDDVVPVNQMCKGEFSDWKKCSKTCGRGKKTRRFNELQKAGKTGIKCIYENGQEQSEECFERICNDGDNCEDDIDCLSGYCDRDRKTCSYRNMCSISQTQNCNFQECKALNDEFGEYSYNLEKNKCENIRKNGYLVKDAIGVGETRDIFKELNNFIEDYNIKYSEEQMNSAKVSLCRNLDLSKGVTKCSKYNKEEQNCNQSWQYSPSGSFSDEINNINNNKVIPCFYDIYNKQCLPKKEGDKFTRCKNLLVCNASKSINSGDTCSALTQDVNSVPIFNDKYKQPSSPGFGPGSGSFTGCLVNNKDNSPGMCGALSVNCRPGNYSRFGDGDEPCSPFTASIPGAYKTSPGTSKYNASFACAAEYFWPGTGLPPKDEYGNYLPVGCMPCINNNASGLPTCSLYSPTKKALSPSIALEQIQKWCNISIPNKAVSGLSGPYQPLKKGSGFMKPYSDGNNVNSKYLVGDPNIIKTYWDSKNGKPKCALNLNLDPQICLHNINLIGYDKYGGLNGTTNEGPAQTCGDVGSLSNLDPQDEPYCHFFYEKGGNKSCQKSNQYLGEAYGCTSGSTIKTTDHCGALGPNTINYN